MIRLEAQRLEIGFTQEKLARAAGVSHSVVCRIEKGHSPGSNLTLAALAKVLEIPVLECRTLIEEVS